MQNNIHSNDAIHVFNDNADLYVEKYMDLHTYDEALDYFSDFLPQKASILDVACGPGNITKYLISKSKNYQILGIDLAENMLSLAEKHNPEATFQLLDGRKIKELNKSFHAIVSGFFSPYLSREELGEFIMDTSRCLLPEGLLFLSTMEDDYSKSGVQNSSTGAYSLHMYFHETDYIKNFASESGLKFLKRYEYDIEGQDIMKDIVLIFQKSN